MRIYHDQFGRLIADHGLGAHYVQPQHTGSLGGLGQFTVSIPPPPPPSTQLNPPPNSCPPPGSPGHTMQGATTCCQPSACVPIQQVMYAIDCRRLKKSDKPGLDYEYKKFKGSKCPEKTGWEEIPKMEL